jgi:alanine racemase
LPTAIPVYLKLNTGMNRLGLSAPELRSALQLLDRTGAASSVTLMTHFSDADEDRGIDEQWARFQAMTDGLRLPMSMANSAALLRFPETVGGSKDWSRPGIMLYGASPMPGHQSADALGLKPVMTLTSEIIGIQHLQAGDRVGYGGTFTAPEAMTVGVVACGYADGYPRHAPTGTPVQVNGQRTRTLGRVSMDKLCVDLTGLKVGAGGTVVPVTLWGEGLPADEVAAAAGTIAYELFCALAGRVDIEYVG